MSLRHFLTLDDFSPSTLRKLIDRAIELKAMHRRREIHEPFRNRVLGMIFEKASTRTRVSFEAGMAQMGGHALFLSPRDTQLGRGEPIEDTARVLSRMVDLIMVRTYEHEMLERFAAHSSVPVINALTDAFHPCQLLADIMTWIEHRGDPSGKTAVWIGDGNNMCNSWIKAAAAFDFKLVISCPQGYEPAPGLVELHRDRLRFERDPMVAAIDADLVATDVWSSMGHESENADRRKAFANYQVSSALLDQGVESLVFMHCLPAHRGEEVSMDVLDDPRSVVWDEAENRLHAQKALMEMLLTEDAEPAAIAYAPG